LQAADHLLSVGCRSIVFLEPFTSPWMEDRVEGARHAIRQAGLRPECLRVLQSSHSLLKWSQHAAVEFDTVIAEALDQDLFKDGVIAPNAAIAHQIVRHALIREKSIGRDFALIGFDDIPASGCAGLTSLRPAYDEIGREAAGLLVRLLGGDRVSLRLCLPSRLMVRDSTRSYKKC
jgi:DNA-binding LacI/PurR family transcriptional regulator